MWAVVKIRNLLLRGKGAVECLNMADVIRISDIVKRNNGRYAENGQQWVRRGQGRDPCSNLGKR